MDQAKELFSKIQSIKDGKEFIEFCNQVLGPVERVHFDFKEKHDTREAKLHDNDRKNLAKAVSGFANSGGGILIWGFEDKTVKPKPIKNIQQFTQHLLEIASQVTDPVVRDIDGYWILSSKDSEEGYGILLVPESTLPPHRVILNLSEIKGHYFARSGNSFIIASHTMLEDMFGRRPKPELILKTQIQHGNDGGTHKRFIILLSIENIGRGIAKSPFMEVEVNKPHKIFDYGIDGNGTFGLKRLSSGNTYHQKYGSEQTIVIHSGITHDVTAINVEFDINTAKNIPNVEIDYKLTAEGIQIYEGKVIIKISEILEIFGYTS